MQSYSMGSEGLFITWGPARWGYSKFTVNDAGRGRNLEGAGSWRGRKLVRAGSWRGQEAGVCWKLAGAGIWLFQEAGDPCKLSRPARFRAQQDAGPSNLAIPGSWPAQQAGVPSKLGDLQSGGPSKGGGQKFAEAAMWRAGKVAVQ
jgi:hypothetical protein